MAPCKVAPSLHLPTGFYSIRTTNCTGFQACPNPGSHVPSSVECFRDSFRLEKPESPRCGCICIYSVNTEPTMRQALIQTQETPVSKTQLEFQPTGLGSWLFLSLHAEVTCASHYQINSLFRIGVKSPQWTFCCCSLLALLYLCKFHGDIKVETSWATCGEVAEVIFFPSLRMLHLQPGFRLISGTPLATGQLELWSKQAFQRFQYRVFLFGTYGLNSSADHWATLLQRDTHAVL